MRPWPKELLNVIPLPPQRGSDFLKDLGGPEGPIIDRPWWRRELCMGPEHDMYRWGDESGSPPIGRASVLAYQFRRTDGAVLRGYDPEPLTAWDLEHPIPHPGFRAGQVWVLPYRHEWDAGEFKNALWRMVEVVGVDIDRKGDPIYVEFSREISIYGSMFSGKLQHGQARAAQTLESYLIADPCCPWLAPWSASATKPKENTP